MYLIQLKSIWAWLCGAMKMAKSYKEGAATKQKNLGQKVAGSKLGAGKDFSLWNLPFLL